MEHMKHTDAGEENLTQAEQTSAGDKFSVSGVHEAESGSRTAAMNRLIHDAPLTPASEGMTLPMEFDGVYVGDLLSRAMSRVEAGSLWLTIMNNINVIAVASLADAAAVVLCEDVRLTPDALAAAESKGVCVLYTPLGAYELCALIAKTV